MWMQLNTMQYAYYIDSISSSFELPSVKQSMQRTDRKMFLTKHREVWFREKGISEKWPKRALLGHYFRRCLLIRSFKNTFVKTFEYIECPISAVCYSRVPFVIEPLLTPCSASWQLLWCGTRFCGPCWLGTPRERWWKTASDLSTNWPHRSHLPSHSE